MAFPTPRRTHNYGFNSEVHHRISKQFMDENGNVGTRSEIVDMTSPKFIETPDRSVMSIEAMSDSGQPLRRVNTCVIPPAVDMLPDAPPVEISIDE